jgi:hypothetical protein
MLYIRREMTRKQASRRWHDNRVASMQRMMGGWAGLALLACLSAPARADGQIYLCVSANGQKELTDINRKGSCKLLDLPGAITSPPKKPASAASGASSGASSSAQPRATTASPADFPRVDNAAQKARDSDRRQILQDELKNEQQKLADLKKEFNDGQPERHGNERNYAKYLERVEQMKENLGRMERNVEALKREIANIR